MAASTRSSCRPAVRPVRGQPVLVEGGGVEGLAVEVGAQCGGLEFDEGVGPAAGGEPDDGGGVECLVPSGQVEVDRVVVDVEEPGTGLRFVARQYGHAAMLPYEVPAGHGPG